MVGELWFGLYISSNHCICFQPYHLKFSVCYQSPVNWHFQWQFLIFLSTSGHLRPLLRTVGTLKPKIKNLGLQQAQNITWEIRHQNQANVKFKVNYLISMTEFPTVSKYLVESIIEHIDATQNMSFLKIAFWQREIIICHMLGSIT